MAEEEDDKPRLQASVPPPSRAEHAAKKLGLRPNSGRFDTVKTPEPKASVPPGAQSSVRPAPQPTATPPVSEPRPALGATTTRPPVSPNPRATDEASAARDARYASRRSLVAGEVPTPEPAAPKPKAAGKSPLKSPIVLAGGGVLLLGALVFGGMTVARLRYESSDDGRVRGRLTDVELAPHDTAVRDAAYGELDGMPNGPKTAIDMLSDTTVAERGSSRSTHKMQELANQYLLHFAAFKKSEPPPKAVEMSKLIFDGQAPNAEQWTSLQQAWRAWLDGKK